MAVREERCADSELVMAWLGWEIDALKLVSMKVDEERDELKVLVNIMMRERTALCARRDNL